MFFWFVIVAPVIVAEVFRSPMVDYRLVAIGAALPLLEVVAGRPLLLHTLFAPVLAMTVIMLGTRQRLRRRQLLGIAIGLFLHLVLDGTWLDQHLFWWPAFGWSFPEEALPAFGRGLGVGLMLEVAAGIIGWWAYRRYGLDDPASRERLLKTGQLPREVF